MDSIAVLVTLDQNYLPALRVLLKSLFVNNAQDTFCIYLMHASIPKHLLEETEQFCLHHGSALVVVTVPDTAFAAAPTFRHYTKAMYYRLLAFELLPAHLDKILYLDPDILAINPLRELYCNTPLKSALIAAASHSGVTDLSHHVNRLRLGTPENVQYYNSGVLLLNLKLLREQVTREEIFAYVQKKKSTLVLPDQDILNGLYGDRILPISDFLYNYDARRYTTYRVVKGTQGELPNVMKTTVFLHFCGSNKPWQAGYRGRFSALYQHYMQLAAR